MPAAFAARRFTGSDDGVWGGLPAQPLCRAPGAEDVTQGVESPGAPAVSLLPMLRPAAGGSKAASCSLTCGPGLSLPVWKMDLGTILRMKGQPQCSNCNTQ